MALAAIETAWVPAAAIIIILRLVLVVVLVLVLGLVLDWVGRHFD